MGYVPPHIYILTGDKRYLADFDKQQKQNVIGITITGGFCFLFLIGALVYSLISIGG